MTSSSKTKPKCPHCGSANVDVQYITVKNGDVLLCAYCGLRGYRSIFEVAA